MGRTRRSIPTGRNAPGAILCQLRGRYLDLPLHHRLLDLGNRLRGIEAFRADLCAIHDRVAAIELERIFERIEPFALMFVAAIGDPTLRLQQGRRAHEALTVPPIGRTRRRAAGAEDAFIESVE